MKTIKSYLPIFPGFYSTIFDSDLAEESTIYNLNEEDGLNLSYDDIEFNYKDYNNRLCLACIGSVENFLKHDGFEIVIHFDELFSPRAYNFSNDTIFCIYKVNKKDFDRLIQYSKDNLSEFKSFLENNYKSYDGFISFFSYDSNVWFNEYLDKDSDKFEKAFAGILEFYLQNEEYTSEDMYYDCDHETCYIDYEILTKS